MDYEDHEVDVNRKLQLLANEIFFSQVVRDQLAPDPEEIIFQSIIESLNQLIH